MLLQITIMNMEHHKTSKGLSFNCYGESLDTSPDFLLAKRSYEESLIDWNSAENDNIEDEKWLHISEQSAIFETPLKENIPILVQDKKIEAYEENILRNNVESLGEARNSTRMV